MYEHPEALLNRFESSTVVKILQLLDVFARDPDEKAVAVVQTHQLFLFLFLPTVTHKKNIAQSMKKKGRNKK